LASKVFYKASVESDLRRLDKPIARKILTQIESKLGQDPSIGISLTGDFAGLFKYRVGDYRVIYAKTRESILILRISHRKDVYRQR